MAIDIVARALAVSGKQNLSNYYTKTESDERYVKSVADTMNTASVYVCLNNRDQTTPLAETPTKYGVAQYNINGKLQTNNPTADLDAVNKKYGENNYYRVAKGTNIPENADLNDYKAAGTYQVPNDTIGKTIKNTPYNYASKLFVEEFAAYTM